MSDVTQNPRSLRRALLVSLIAVALGSLPGAAVAAPGQGFLPDGRAWELVSPPEKNGGEVMPYPVRTRASADGNELQFASLSGFGDVMGTGVSADYLSRRAPAGGGSGWSTTGLLPQLESLSLDRAIFATDTFYAGDFSSDFSMGILRTGTNLSGDPNLAEIPGLYLRTDLQGPGPGSYITISSCPLCTAPIPLPLANASPLFIAATADMGHILFEAPYNLVAGATGGRQKLYEWDHGTLRLVGILPADEGGEAATRSFAGFGSPGLRNVQRVMSADGSRIYFTTEPRVSPIYLREGATTTMLVNASERTDCAGDPSCGGDGVPDPAPDPAGTQPGRFWSASADGDGFFTTEEKLVDEDENGVSDLYRYDASLPPGDPHNLSLVSVADPGFVAGTTAVYGVSEDGSRVYFTAGGQLLADDPGVQTEGLYLWDEGDITRIGDLSNGAGQKVNAEYGANQLGSRMTPDGRYLLFTATDGAGLTGYDHSMDNPLCRLGGEGRCTELYVYDADADRLACASCNPSGAPATVDASFMLATGIGASPTTTHLGRPLAGDGSRVFFTSGEKLVPEDENGVLDAYQYDVASGEIHLLSSGKDESDSYFLDAGTDGDDAFFATRERLSGWDRDSSYDVYDARVGGGRPEPVVVSQCNGEACRGALAAPPPPIPPPGSTEPRASGNADRQGARKRCAKGKVPKRAGRKVRCVKKQSKKQGRIQRGTK